MEFLAVKWWMLLVGVFVSMLTGSLWYNPKTFFPVWWAGIGKGDTQPGMENMGMVWGLTMLAAGLKTYFIGVAINLFAPVLAPMNLLSGLEVGFLLWVGVIVPTYLTNHLFTGYPFKVYFIEVGNHLLDYLIMGAIFAVVI